MCVQILENVIGAGAVVTTEVGTRVFVVIFVDRKMDMIRNDNARVRAYSYCTFIQADLL